MMWFKHRSDASEDEFICALEDRFGLEGYARWWKLLEAISKQMDKGDKCYAEYSIKKWKKILCAHFTETLKEFILFCVSHNVIQLETIAHTTLITDSLPPTSSVLSESNKEKTMRVYCAKLLELRDEYSRKMSRAPDRVRIHSGIDKEAEKEKDCLIIKSKRTKEEFDRKLAAEIAAVNHAEVENKHA